MSAIQQYAPITDGAASFQALLDTSSTPLLLQQLCQYSNCQEYRCQQVGFNGCNHRLRRSSGKERGRIGLDPNGNQPAPVNRPTTE
jgi:hypothetical protein